MNTVQSIAGGGELFTATGGNITTTAIIILNPKTSGIIGLEPKGHFQT